MNERFEKFSHVLFFTLLLLELIIIVFLGFRKHTNISLFNESEYPMNSGWVYTDDSGSAYQVTLPAKLDAGPDNSVTISRILPSNLDFMMNLSMLTSHQNIEVYLDSKLIYFRYNEPSDHLFDIPTYSVWDLVRLPIHSEGKLLSIVIFSHYDDYAGVINEVHAGTTAALLVRSLQTSGLGLVLAIITFLMGVIMIFTYLYLKRLVSISRAILYLGLFTILCSTWLIMESNLMQIFITNEYVISALTYLTLMTFPIPIIIYISYLTNYHYRTVITCMTYIFIISAFILIILQLFNIMDFHESSFLVRSELFVLLGCVIITLLLEQIQYNNKEIRIFTVASVILFLFGILELLTYRIRSSNIGVAFQIGFILFIIILSWDAMRKAAEIIKMSESAKHYKFLATKDLLTSCRNRVSYARDMDRVSLERNITMFIADMDNMKEINDNFGHHTGDEVIVLCSHCLINVFGRRVYRIGGDEFVSIQYDLDQEHIDTLLKQFVAECAKTNEDIPYKFSMSVGYAVFDKDIDKTIYDTVKRADKDMYEKKNRKKSNQIT
jgi:diguanylate cyclase (GGDEF)-like protein